MPADGASPFEFEGGTVAPDERFDFRFSVSETYLGDPVRLPVTVINGPHPGPVICLTAASHGDELNGVEVVRTVAQEWDYEDLHGTIVCLPVLNVPGFLSQHRYLPILDRDLNRSFPGDPSSTSARRIAHHIYENFIAPADYVLDFHTSTRGRNNMLHVRADLESPAVERIAKAFGAHVIIQSEGPAGSLRREATEDDIPSIVVEMGQAHRFQRDMIDSALQSVESVFAELGMIATSAVKWPGWRTVVDGGQEKTWIRADAGGIVDMHYDGGALVREGDAICTISNPFMADRVHIDAPFSGLIVGVLENPVVYPGNPLCHLIELDRETRRVIETAHAPRAP